VLLSKASSSENSSADDLSSPADGRSTRRTVAGGVGRACRREIGAPDGRAEQGGLE
jgi:hypothetical protein